MPSIIADNMYKLPLVDTPQYFRDMQQYKEHLLVDILSRDHQSLFKKMIESGVWDSDKTYHKSLLNYTVLYGYEKYVSILERYEHDYFVEHTVFAKKICALDMAKSLIHDNRRIFTMGLYDESYKASIIHQIFHHESNKIERMKTCIAFGIDVESRPQFPDTYNISEYHVLKEYMKIPKNSYEKTYNMYWSILNCDKLCAGVNYTTDMIALHDRITKKRKLFYKRLREPLYADIIIAGTTM